MSVYEQEVVINTDGTNVRFDAGGDPAEMYTSNPVWIRKMDKLCAEHPESFVCTKVDTYQGKPYSKCYTFPARLITIKSGVRVSNMTDEQRREASERIQAYNAAKKAGKL